MIESLVARLVRRPVTVTAFFVLVTAMAGIALFRLPIALLPALDYPSLAVWTGFRGATPDQVQTRVTEPIEQALAGAPGLVSMTSRSQVGGSLVQLELGWQSDLDLTRSWIREQLESVGGPAWEGVERPLIVQVDPSDRPIMVLAVSTSGGHATGGHATGGPETAEEIAAELGDLKRLARDVLVRRIEQLSGVSRVRLSGGFDPEISIDLRPDRLATHGLSFEQVEQALGAANIHVVGGTILSGSFRYAVELSGRFATLEDIGDTVVSGSGRAPIRLRDVAQIREGFAERRGLVRLDERETLLLLVERRPDANTVETAREVREVLAAQRAEMPGLGLDVVVDESGFIEASLDAVAAAVLGGGVLALLVLLLFVRRSRALLAVAVALPLSLALTLVLFEILSVSLNLLSLAGLALGIGMLVDNAIVVVENISRWRENGVPADVAASRGAAEVAAPIAASTLTTIAVFLPLSFVDGLAGRLFRDQSTAVVCSLAASLFVALTVVPLIASRDAEEASEGRDSAAWQRPFEAALAWCMAHRLRVTGLSIVFLVTVAALGLTLPHEVLPSEDRGRIHATLSVPPDATLGLLDRRAAEIERIVTGWRDVETVLADLGEHDASRLDLEPRPPYQGDLWLQSSDGAAASEIVERLRHLPLPADTTLEVQVVGNQLESLLEPLSADLVIDLSGRGHRELGAAAEALVAELQTRRSLARVVHVGRQALRGMQLQLDQDAMARFGVEADDLAATLEAVSQGRRATRLQKVDSEIPVVLRTAGVSSLPELLAQRLPAAHGSRPLASLLEVREQTQPAALLRRNQAQVARVLVDQAPGVDLKTALADVHEALQVAMPPGIWGKVSGANDAFESGRRATLESLFISLLLVYLILAAQFESLLQPWVVVSTVPLAAGGVVLALAVTGQSWNLMSLTGCVVLVGIAVNNAIVMVDFIHKHHAATDDLPTAIRRAAKDRLRPMLMTTTTTVVGLLPVALGLGAGSGLRSPMAIAIIGGLVVATLLTLTVVPVLYYYTVRLVQRLETVRGPWGRRAERPIDALDPT